MRSLKKILRKPLTTNRFDAMLCDMDKMTVSLANQITGGLSSPSKMPCYGFSTPPQACITGAKLRKVKGSVCHTCYAFRGHYQFTAVKSAQARRLAGLNHPRWVEAMVYLIDTFEDSGFFRWHDAGDLQSVAHLERIIDVCNHTQNIMHWLPTREYGIVADYKAAGGIIPANLCIRLSAYMMEGKPPTSVAAKLGVQTSGVSKVGYTCPASNQGNKCMLCRACWNTGVENINYKRH